MLFAGAWMVVSLTISCRKHLPHCRHIAYRLLHFRLSFNAKWLCERFLLAVLLLDVLLREQRARPLSLLLLLRRTVQLAGGWMILMMLSWLARDGNRSMVVSTAICWRKHLSHYRHIVERLLRSPLPVSTKRLCGRLLLAVLLLDVLLREHHARPLTSALLLRRSVQFTGTWMVVSLTISCRKHLPHCRHIIYRLLLFRLSFNAKWLCQRFLLAVLLLDVLLREQRARPLSLLLLLRRTVQLAGGWMILMIISWFARDGNRSMVVSTAICCQKHLPHCRHIVGRLLYFRLSFNAKWLCERA